jgi:predicted ATPase
MIKKVGFENIRVFKELAEFELKPVTILIGPNNAGKSTLQKMLMVLASGLKKVNNEVLLSKLEFTDSLLNSVGTIHNNITYGSNKNEIKFKFEFEFEVGIFENIGANLSYKAKGKDAELVEISFTSNSELLFSYKLIKNDDEFIYGDYWRMDVETYHNYISKLYDRIIYLRELGRKQIVLKEVAFKLKRNKNAMSDFSEDEKLVFNYYKNRGIVAGCTEAIELQNESWYEAYEIDNDIHRPCVYDFNTNFIYFENRIANDVYEKFKENKSRFLINSILLKEIVGDFDLFLESTQEKDKRLINSLKENRIINSDLFYEKYVEFEKFFIGNYFKNLLIPTEDIGGIDRTLGIDRILKLSGEIPLEIKNIDTSFLNKYSSFKNNLIVKIIYESGLMEEIADKPIFIPSNIIDNMLKGENLSRNKPLEVKAKESFFFMSPAKSLKMQLSSFLNNVELSNQDGIKKYFMLDDANSSSSPFIKFGKKKNEYSYTQKKEFVDKWLSELKISEELIINEITVGSHVIGYYYSLLKNKIEVPLSDNGMGINQMVLLLLKIVTSEPSTLFLLEEPEVNMHPALQSKLANLFTDAYKKFKSRFIIETHSEYLIRKLQYLVSSIDSGLQKEDVIMYYFNDDEAVSNTEPKVKEIFINEDGGLTDSFGPGFFDEATKLQFDLIKLNKQQLN